MKTIENSKNTLTALLNRVKAQTERAADYLAPTDQLQFRTTSDGDKAKSEIVLELNRGEPTRILDVNQVCFDQIANRAGIDTRTAGRLQVHYTKEFDQLINAIWQKENAVRMIRSTMENEREGTARAFLSDRFKTFDNSHLLNAALPQLMDSDAQWRIVHGDVTDKRMYVRLKSEAITGDGAAVGDVMALGIGLSNSEVGCGSVQVYQMFWTLACLNGMQTENRTRKSHITSARGDSDTWGLLTDEAKYADNHALELKIRDKIRDMVSAYASRESFDQVLQKMRDAAADTINGSANAAVESLGKVLQLTKKDTSNVLDGLLATISQPGYSGSPISRATMINAVTAVAHKADTDNVDDWQKLGGRVLDLPANDWQRIASAA